RDAVRERIEPGDARQGRRAAVARKVRDEQPTARQEQRRELGPVRGRAAQSVHEHEGVALARDEIAHSNALDVGKTFLETVQLCVRHTGRLSWEAMNGFG